METYQGKGKSLELGKGKRKRRNVWKKEVIWIRISIPNLFIIIYGLGFYKSLGAYYDSY
jgi:hypothetical protein